MLHNRIAKATLFLAPSGMFFLPIPALGSFRLFYIPLLLLNLWSFAHLRKKNFTEIGILFFIAAVFWWSAAYGYIAFSVTSAGVSGNPFVRWAVIVNLMFGFYFLGCWLQESKSSFEWFEKIDIAYSGFILVFVLGFLLYMGVVFGPVPGSVYTRFVTVDQSAFGYLRFSPGTYPNEFGTICSFFALYALIKNTRQGGMGSLVVALMALVGIALASTRSAYITLVVGAIIVFVGIPSLRRRAQALIGTLIAVPLGLILLSLLSFNTIGVLTGGYQASLNPTQGSLGERLSGWSEAASEFSHFPFWGFGFESPSIIFLHNLFLQELFGLGLLGCALVIILSIFFWLIRKDKRASDPLPVHSASDYRYVTLIRLVALEHVVLFGLNNHNQTHFLTWLSFSFFVCNLRKFENASL